MWLVLTMLWNGDIFRVTDPLWGKNPLVTGESSQRPVTRIFDISLMCAWTNGWANNRYAGDLRRHPPHYDGIVMYSPKPNSRTSYRNRRSYELDDLLMLTQSPKKDGLQVKFTEGEAGFSDCLTHIILFPISSPSSPTRISKLNV